MRIKYWGARGSIPTPGPEMSRHGGNTSCVELTLSDGNEVILDAGTGITALGRERTIDAGQVHLLLTHLHLDHIQGLMFFEPLFDPACEVHVTGPAALGGPLLNRLARYISAPLAPIEIRELPARVSFDDVTGSKWQFGPATIEAAFVNHRGPTLGYRITDDGVTVTYIPDHEPALGQRIETSDPEWISGMALARDADLLIHDAQYTEEEYSQRLGWGHSAISHTVEFARRSGARRLALFHHDPLHDDTAVDAITEAARALGNGSLARIDAAREGEALEISAG
jgi:phosphoribosyl 1,2-cyclic phosphodiesterase